MRDFDYDIAMVNSIRKKPVARGQKNWKFAFIAAVVTIVLLVILLIQAIMGLTGLMSPKGLNYYGQPVDPMLQLVTVSALLLIPVLWLVFRKKLSKDHKRDRSWKKPFIPGQVPDRFPWQ
jgi:membrane protease YdiL (CAAX protease family)